MTSSSCDSTFNHIQDFAGVTIGKLLVFKTIIVTAAAEPDDLIHIVRGNIPAADIAEIIIFTVKRTDYVGRHEYLICKTSKVHYVHR